MRVPWHYLGTGPVRQLEAKLVQYTGMRHALLVPSATTGLLLVGLALGLRPGDRFITSPVTWGSSLVWLYLGCRVVFADVEPNGLTLDPEATKACIDDRTRVILSVDPDGIPADDEALRQVADAFGLVYVADCARSFGAWRWDRPAGFRAHVVVFSFTYGKPLDLGEGGAVLTDDDALYERLLLLGQHPLRQKREIGLEVENSVALNARIHPAAALRGVRTFHQALRRIEVQRKRFGQLRDAVWATGLVAGPVIPPGVKPSGFRLSVVWRGQPQPQRLAKFLERQGWSVSVEPYPRELIYSGPFFRKWFSHQVDASPCPVAERAVACRWLVVGG